WPDRDLGALGREARGHLDVVRDSDAAQPAARPRLVAPRGKTAPVRNPFGLVYDSGAYSKTMASALALAPRGRSGAGPGRPAPRHRLAVRAAVVHEAEGVAVRHRRLRDEVAPAQLDPVHPELARREVDQPLDHEDRLGAARAAVRR